MTGQVSSRLWTAVAWVASAAVAVGTSAMGTPASAGQASGPDSSTAATTLYSYDTARGVLLLQPVSSVSTPATIIIGDSVGTALAQTGSASSSSGSTASCDYDVRVCRHDGLDRFAQEQVVPPRGDWEIQTGSGHRAIAAGFAGFVAAEDAAPLIKLGTSGGETAGRVLPRSVRDATLEDNPSTCVFCRMETDAPQVDHAIPRARGGDATIGNAQTLCPWCNASKGARDLPVNPPPTYEGPWPPSWWRR